MEKLWTPPFPLSLLFSKEFSERKFRGALAILLVIVVGGFLAIIAIKRSLLALCSLAEIPVSWDLLHFPLQ